MERIAQIAKILRRSAARVLSQSVRWYLLLLVVVAGPLAADIVVLFDLAVLVGGDVFVLSLIYYFSGSLSDLLAVWGSRSRRCLQRQGAIWPSLGWRTPFSELARYSGHNLCVLITPVRFTGFGLLCFPLAALLSFLSASHVA